MDNIERLHASISAIVLSVMLLWKRVLVWYSAWDSLVRNRSILSIAIKPPLFI